MPEFSKTCPVTGEPCTCGRFEEAALDADIDSVALRRIIQEVRCGTAPAAGYNRVYTRHNRSP